MTAKATLTAQERTLEEVLAQQRATTEILRLISRTHDSAQPVFDTIAAAALRLCGATAANVFTVDSERLHVAAMAVVDEKAAEAMRSAFPRPPDRGTVASRAILTGSAVSIPDVMQDPHYSIGEFASAAGFRSAVGIPLVHAGKPIGAIAVGRAEPGPFPEHQVALLETFADQAVIAIENVRLFIALRGEIESHRKSKATIHVLVEDMAAGRDAMAGDSPALQRVRAQIAQVSGTDSTVRLAPPPFADARMGVMIKRCFSVEQSGWLALRHSLWPDGTVEEHLSEMSCFCANPERYAQFVAYSDSNAAVGFVEAAIRTDYVNGTSSTPIAFLEGLYVAPEARRRGVARSLVSTVKHWAIDRGCRELASDALLDNDVSHAVHRALGFEETERVVFFRSSLG